MTQLSKFTPWFPLVMALVGIGLASTRVLAPLHGFYIFLLGCLLGAIFLIGMGVWAAIKHRWPEWSLILPVLIPAFVVVGFVIYGQGQPLINDVTTDLGDPPNFIRAHKFKENEKRDFAYSAQHIQVSKEVYPQLRSMEMSQPLAEAAAKIKAMIEARNGWYVSEYQVGQNEAVIEAIAESGAFRFKDDVVIRVRKSNAGSVVDMRSKSRDGRKDLSANFKRIQQFFSDLH